MLLLLLLLAEDWTPKKLEVEVPMPEELHLESLRSQGPLPGEQLQPEDRPAAAAAGVAGTATPASAEAEAAAEPDAVIVAQLVSMGFSENGSMRAGESPVACPLSGSCQAMGCLQV
jgi:ubiquitin carboxyl-terminal hydrolase 5/13